MTTSRIRVRVGASLLSAVMVALFCNAVSAQEEDIEEERGVPIYERSRPELEPLGLRAGAFMIRPSLSVGGEYNDNIYATKNNRESDFISRVTPNVSVQSDWSRHALSLDVGAEAGFYFDNSKENYIDGHAGLAGRIDLLRETFLEGHLSVQRRHEDRGDPDVPLANDEPSVYYEYNTGISAYRGKMPHLTRRSVGLGVSSIGEQVLMTKLLSGIAGIVIGLATATTASANCNASFDGIWKWQGQGQGQYTEVELIHASPFSDISVQTETGTCRGRLMISCLIYDARYDAQRYGNVSAQMINGTTCQLDFGVPHLEVATYGSDNIARQAHLTASGNRIQWCWRESGHQFGECISFEKQ